MYGDALEEFLVFLRALYCSQGDQYTYLGSYCKQYLLLMHSSICVYNIQLKQHTFGHNNISVFYCVAGVTNAITKLNLLATQFIAC